MFCPPNSISMLLCRINLRQKWHIDALRRHDAMRPEHTTSGARLCVHRDNKSITRNFHRTRRINILKRATLRDTERRGIQRTGGAQDSLKFKGKIRDNDRVSFGAVSSRRVTVARYRFLRAWLYFFRERKKVERTSRFCWKREERRFIAREPS